MVNIGEYVSYKTTGVCTVDSVIKMEIPGTKDQKDYYVLKPVYDEQGVIYCPVDYAENFVRAILSKDEANILISELETLPMFDMSNKKILDETCKTAMDTGLTREYLIVMKTLWAQRVQRIAEGKKITTTNDRFFKACQDKACGELAVALGQDKTEVVAMLRSILEEKITM